MNFDKDIDEEDFEQFNYPRTMDGYYITPHGQCDVFFTTEYEDDIPNKLFLNLDDKWYY